MSAETLGGRLLGEVKEEGLEELLQTLRHLARPHAAYKRTHLPAFDRLLSRLTPHHAARQSRIQPAPHPTSSSSPQHPAGTTPAHPPTSTHTRATLAATIEIAGPTCSGKTQLLYSIAAVGVLPVTFKERDLGGAEGVVVVIDAEGRFDVRRLREVMRGYVLRRLRGQGEPGVWAGVDGGNTALVGGRNRLGHLGRYGTPYKPCGNELEGQSAGAEDEKRPEGHEYEEPMELTGGRGDQPWLSDGREESAQEAQMVYQGSTSDQLPEAPETPDGEQCRGDTDITHHDSEADGPEGHPCTEDKDEDKQKPPIHDSDLTALLQTALSHIHIYRPTCTQSLLRTLEVIPTHLFSQQQQQHQNRPLHALLLDSPISFLPQDRLEQETSSILTATAAFTATVAAAGPSNTHHHHHHHHAISTPTLHAKFTHLHHLLLSLHRRFDAHIIYTSPDHLRAAAFGPGIAPPPPPQLSSSSSSSFSSHQLPTSWLAFARLKLILTRDDGPGTRSFARGVSAAEAWARERVERGLRRREEARGEVAVEEEEAGMSRDDGSRGSGPRSAVMGGGGGPTWFRARLRRPGEWGRGAGGGGGDGGGWEGGGGGGRGEEGFRLCVAGEKGVMFSGV